MKFTCILHLLVYSLYFLLPRDAEVSNLFIFDSHSQCPTEVSSEFAVHIKVAGDWTGMAIFLSISIWTNFSVLLDTMVVIF